tara:strand:- start:1251 stop:1784 length:534 start_codon:yes stop_codon:yes gene_type:complete
MKLVAMVLVLGCAAPATADDHDTRMQLGALRMEQSEAADRQARLLEEQNRIAREALDFERSKAARLPASPVVAGQRPRNWRLITVAGEFRSFIDAASVRSVGAARAFDLMVTAPDLPSAVVAWIADCSSRSAVTVTGPADPLTGADAADVVDVVCGPPAPAAKKKAGVTASVSPRRP